MLRNKIDFDAARRIAPGLSGVEEFTTYGSPALKVREQRRDQEADRRERANGTQIGAERAKDAMEQRGINGLRSRGFAQSLIDVSAVHTDSPLLARPNPASVKRSLSFS